MNPADGFAGDAVCLSPTAIRFLAERGLGDWSGWRGRLVSVDDVYCRCADVAGVPSHFGAKGDEFLWPTDWLRLDG